MKLKCNHNRRVMVLPSGTIIHRNDGSICKAHMTIGGNKVTKLFTVPEGKFVDLGVERTPGQVLLQEIFEGG